MAELYQDIDIFGDEYNNGNAKEYFDRDALKNAIKMWMMSKRGDFIDAPEEGGLLEKYNFKNLNGDLRDKMVFDIETDLQLFFDGLIVVNDIIVNQNRVQKFTEIEVLYTDILNGEESSITVYPSEVSYKPVIKYTDIEFIGENLFNIVKIKKPDMLNQKLKFSLEENVWIWGNRFRFTNFDFSDPYFEQIIAYINLS